MDRAQRLQGLVVGVERELPAPEVDGKVVNCPCRCGELEKVRAVVFLVGLQPSAGLHDHLLLSVVHLRKHRSHPSGVLGVPSGRV